MEFKTSKLGDVAKIIMGQSPKSEFYSDYSGTPFLQGNRTFKHRFPQIDTYTKKITKMAEKDDILFSVRAPVGDMNIAPHNLCIGRGLCAIRALDINKDYLYYLLKSKIAELESQSTGTIFSSINKRTLENFNIKIPNMVFQNYIGSTLTNIDEKIENNKNTIANLEELLQTIFKRWFIDFEFPDENGNPYKSSGGKMKTDEYFKNIPHNWSSYSLDEIATFTNGLAMQKYRPENNEFLPVIKIRELRNGNTDSSSDKCTPGIPHKVKVFNGDIIFSWSATLMVKMWAGGNAGLNQHLFKVTSENYPKWLYYLWTNHHVKSFQNIAKDKATTMGHINRKHLSQAKVVIPDSDFLYIANDNIQPLLNKIENLSIQNENLSNLRNSLLPKLMSGEIELPEDLEV